MAEIRAAGVLHRCALDRIGTGDGDHAPAGSTEPCRVQQRGPCALEGPHSRRKELWLVLRAVRDFIAGFRILHFVGPCVTVFGSARYPETHPWRAGLARSTNLPKR
jgi:hypothetical protein